MYPALAVLEQMRTAQPDLRTLWVGSEGGMEADLVAKTDVPFEAIPAAGLHGVGLRALPGNLWDLLRGFFAARTILRRFRPEALFFTGGYVAIPMALAGLGIPSVVYVPDIEPALALRLLARFSDRIAVSTADSRIFFPRRRDRVVVTGYPVRADLTAWRKKAAYREFDLSPDLPTLLVTGGSLGALSINRALAPILPDLLPEMQILHLTGRHTWSQFKDSGENLAPELAARYRVYPYLHDRMGAAFTVADAILCRAGASTLGELPHFGLAALLVPYPHAWRYQRVNAEYLVDHGAAQMLADADLEQQLKPMLLDLIRDENRREAMSTAMGSLAQPDAAASIGQELLKIASSNAGNEDVTS